MYKCEIRTGLRTLSRTLSFIPMKPIILEFQVNVSGAPYSVETVVVRVQRTHYVHKSEMFMVMGKEI